MEKPNLTWNVYRLNINNREIEVFNIFNHYSFLMGCAKAAKKHTRMEFAEEVKHELMYYYWSKCEWEVLVSDWTSPDFSKSQKKIDVYQQIMLNFDQFIDYLWANKSELKKIKAEVM